VHFLHESLVDLDDSLKKLGSGLSVFCGQPEKAIPALVKAYTDKGLRVEGVWLGAENSHEEIQTQQQLEQALKDSGSALHLVDARRTLIDRADLPFDPKSKDMPDVYTTFRQKVENLGSDMVRRPLPAPEKFKPLPEPVEIPATAGSLQLSSSDGLKNVLPQLLKPLESEEKGRRPDRSDVPYKGGLTAGGKRLEHYCVGQSAPIATYKETRNGTSKRAGYAASEI
jgi:deoxyribodipyrimidine photo-lyase